VNVTTKQTGTKGLLKIQDNTDGPNKTVDLYVASVDPIAVASLPWSYSIDDVGSDTKSFNFLPTTAWQHVGRIYVGYAETFLFHLAATGHVELGGPIDLAVILQNSTKTAIVKIGNEYKRAIPYVKVGDIWKQTIPFVAHNGVWTETV
jgi:hypothetical protein